MIKFVAQVKKVANAKDGGFTVTFDVTENFISQAKVLLGSTDKNLAVVIEEMK